MSYFLKKSNIKKGLYLQIYENFYDPISYFQAEVDEFNRKHNEKKNSDKIRQTAHKITAAEDT